MKNLLLIVFLCLNLIFDANAQLVKVFYENKNYGFVFYANNEELYPVSISLDLNLSNLIFSEGNKRIFIIPSKSEKLKIGELTSLNNGPTQFSYNYRKTFGDVTLKNYDTSFKYFLPFEKGEKYKIYQGYNGVLSHQNEYSLDFSMPEGTAVVAARDGMVVQLIQNNTESCPELECQKFNNYIMVMHTDGTFAYYGHIKYNGSNRKIGENVKAGDVIAYSGKVGWATGPHLHFACFLSGFGKWQTIETKFRTDKGDTVEILKEGKEYLRDY